jgi:hypothetical protein
MALLVLLRYLLHDMALPGGHLILSGENESYENTVLIVEVHTMQ